MTGTNWTVEGLELPAKDTMLYQLIVLEYRLRRECAQGRTCGEEAVALRRQIDDLKYGGGHDLTTVGEAHRVYFAS